MSDDRIGSGFARAWSILCWPIVGLPVLAVLVLTASALRGLEPLVVGSGSMAPTIDQGDLVLVDPSRTIRVGDVVVYVTADEAGGRQLHRVVAIADDGSMTTRGDANPTPDVEVVPREDVLGVLHRRIPWLGNPTYWLRLGNPWAFLLWLPAVTAARKLVRRSRMTSRFAISLSVCAGAAGAVLVSASVSVVGAAYTSSTTNSPNTVSSSTWTTYRSVAMGDKHTCAVRFDRTAWCWGSNADGQLGDDSLTDRWSPVQVVGAGGAGFFTDVDRIYAGTSHTCAIKIDATAWCWGRNDRGQLGDNTTTDRDVPTQVVGAGGAGLLSSVIALTAGAFHGCAVKTDTTVWCWGKNTNGQLGDDTTGDRSAPVQVLGTGGPGLLTGAATISAGTSHTCSVQADASVRCWGRNDRGQLGDGTTTDRRVPTVVVGSGGIGTLTTIASVSTGGSHTCGVKVAGTAWCWGKNTNGQLGDNTTSERTTPTQVVGSGGVGFITDVRLLDSSGKESTCAIKNDWTTWCWGDNSKRQLGDGTAVDRTSPVQVVGAGGVGHLPASELVGVGAEHGCAVSSTDGFSCWGGNSRGQIGDGSNTDRDYPTPALITP